MKKISRNDLCWCGSATKYKTCHLEQDQKLAILKQQGYPIPPRRLIKTPAQIEGIANSGQLTKKILQELNTVIKPGITTNDINDWVHAYTIKHGATPAPLNYKGFPKSTCISINEEICHGIPGDRVVKDGDLVNVDVTCIIDGFYGDSCRMYEVGTVSDEAKALNKVTEECLYLGIDAVKPFRTISEIGIAIETHAHKHGYGVVTTFGGHGIGTKFHEDPFIFHYNTRQKEMVMVPGMTFTIEPMINIGKPGGKILDNDWTAVTVDGSLSAQWEHTVVVTETSARILT